VGSANFNYSKNNQILDFGAQQSHVNIRVSQLSNYGITGQSVSGDILSTYVIPTQLTILTIGGIFEVGLLINVYAGTNNTPLVSYVTNSGDASLSGVAASLASAIDASAAYSATVSGQIISMRGPFAIVYVDIYRPSSSIYVGTGRIQDASPARDATRTIANVRIQNSLTGNTGIQIPTGTTIGLIIDSPPVYITYTTNVPMSANLAYQKLNEVFDANSQLSSSGWFMNQGGDASGQIAGPIGVRTFDILTTGGDPWRMSVSLQIIGQSYSAIPLPQITEFAIIGPGTPAVNDAFTVVLSGVPYTYTAGAASSKLIVANGLVSLINSSGLYSAVVTYSVSDVNFNVTSLADNLPFTFDIKMASGISVVVS
jgi:hypothetical protein